MVAIVRSAYNNGFAILILRHYPYTDFVPYWANRHNYRGQKTVRNSAFLKRLRLLTFASWSTNSQTIILKISFLIAYLSTSTLFRRFFIVTSAMPTFRSSPIYVNNTITYVWLKENMAQCQNHTCRFALQTQSWTNYFFVASWKNPMMGMSVHIWLCACTVVSPQEPMHAEVAWVCLCVVNWTIRAGAHVWDGLLC